MAQTTCNERALSRFDVSREAADYWNIAHLVPSVSAETIETLLKIIAASMLVIAAWLPGAGLWTAKIDPSQIDQIMANLFVNARAAIANVGKITVLPYLFSGSGLNLFLAYRHRKVIIYSCKLDLETLVSGNIQTVGKIRVSVTISFG